MMRRLLDYVDQSLDSVRDWLDGHPRMQRALERTGCLRFDRRAVGRGVAIGLFVALTPTVGLQVLMMLGACLLVRGNFPAAFLISWISNPVTMGPLYVGYHALGELVFSPLIHAWLNIAGYDENAAVDVSYVALGSLLIAIPAAIAGYFLVEWVWRRWIFRRRSKGYLAVLAERAERDERARKRAEEDGCSGPGDPRTNGGGSR